MRIIVGNSVSRSRKMLVRRFRNTCSALVDCLFGSRRMLVWLANIACCVRQQGIRSRNHSFSPLDGVFFFYSECQYFAIVL